MRFLLACNTGSAKPRACLFNLRIKAFAIHINLNIVMHYYFIGLANSSSRFTDYT